MIILDAHQDIALSAVALGRDYLEHTLIKRKREADTSIPAKDGNATIGLPDALIGRVALVFSTLFTAPQHTKTSADYGNIYYETPAQAYTHAMTQLDYYHRIQDKSAQLRIIKTQADLAAVLATWSEGKSIEDHVQGLVILMENGDPIVEPKQFEEWYERGVRLVGLAWVSSRYCGGTGEPGGLTTLGRELLDVMAAHNAILDLSHMAEEAFFDSLHHYEKDLIIASHSNPRKFRNSDRHLSDSMITQLAERDGVMGIVLYNRFLSDTWVKGSLKRDLPLSVAVDAIDYVCQLTGSAAHVGIGSDFDGGFGAESIPDGLDTVSDLIRIADLLRERGYNADDIDAIMSGNMLRKLRQALPD